MHLLIIYQTIHSGELIFTHIRKNKLKIMISFGLTGEKKSIIKNKKKLQIQYFMSDKNILHHFFKSFFFFSIFNLHTND